MTALDVRSVVRVGKRKVAASGRVGIGHLGVACFPSRSRAQHRLRLHRCRRGGWAPSLRGNVFCLRREAAYAASGLDADRPQQECREMRKIGRIVALALLVAPGARAAD